MSGIETERVDVVIVGSGPAGAVFAFGMPRPWITYALTHDDDRTVAQMREHAERSAAAIGELVDPPVLAAGGSSLHYQGTVRMGPCDDGTSVCDTYGRVSGVRNLVVGSNGVIPTATASNPTLTTVALTWRAAMAIAREPSAG